jgi:hypothetical protein
LQLTQKNGAEVIHEVHLYRRIAPA